MTRLFSATFFVAITVGIANGQFVSQSFIGNFPEPPGANAEFVLDGSAAWEQNGFITVTPGEGGQNGGFYTNALGSGSYDNLNISFDLRISETSDNGGADGYGFALLPTSTYGADITGDNPGFSEEVNLAGAFGVGFDTFDNNDADRTGLDGVVAAGTSDRLNESSLSIHYDGAQLGSIYGPAQTPPFNFEVVAGEVANFNVDMTIVPDGAGNSTLTTVLTNIDTGDAITPVDGLMVSGMDIQDYRIAFRGRTGGAWNKQEVGNITINEDGSTKTLALLEPGSPPPPPSLVGGSPFSGLNAPRGTEPGPVLANDSGASGEVDGYLRLTSNTGGQHNFVTFDEINKSSTTTTTFNFRGRQNTGADGFSMFLADAGASPEGTVGVGDDVWPAGAAEDPKLTGGFGVGFKTFESEEIRVRWDGEEIANVAAPFAIKRSTDEWHTAKITVAEADAPAANAAHVDGSNVRIELTDGATGESFVVYDDFIAGMAFHDGSRLGFGGRTGGANDFYEIDNINQVPEPGSLGMLGLAIAGLMSLRRRHK